MTINWPDYLGPHDRQLLQELYDSHSGYRTMAKAINESAFNRGLWPVCGMALLRYLQRMGVKRRGRGGRNNPNGRRKWLIL